MASIAEITPDAQAGQIQVQIENYGGSNPMPIGNLEPASPSLTTRDTVAALRNRLGHDVVLLPIRRGQKAPQFNGWPDVTVERMGDPAYLAQLNQGSIGVLLGKPSSGLCSIDIDTDEGVDAFLALNPTLANTLQTRGSRGRNLWVRIRGQYPPLTRLNTADGHAFGEWRADGGQTVIHGVHPTGVPYQIIVDATPLEIEFDSLVWPEQLQLPWFKTPYQLLVDMHGEPYHGSTSSLTLNHRFFVGNFTAKRRVLFEPTETTFYGYLDESGLWQPMSEETIKEKFCRDLKSAADELGEQRIASKITDTLTNSLKNMLKGHIERANSFERVNGLIHTQNGMLDIRGVKPVLQPFDPEFYSRNQITYDWNETAECPRFQKELLEAALDKEDVDLLQRWCGSVLLGVNSPQRMMIFTGLGGTGKSTIATIVEGIIGQSNVASLRTNHLADRFELSAFSGKTLLTGKDVAGNFLNTDGAHIIKALCGGDLLEAEVKGGGRFHLRGDFNVMITSNNRLWLKIDGDSEAWKRRLLIIEFNQQRGGKTIPNFAEQLLQLEGSGILRWMVQGAIKLTHEIREQGGYVLTPTQVNRIDRIVSESDSVKAFVRDRVVAEEGAQVTSERLVAAYTQHCQSRQWFTLPVRIVERQLPDAMMEIHRASKSNDLQGDYGTQRGYRGFTLSEEVCHAD